MAKRKPISKAMRQRVFDKYNGHCAYCGCELEITDMQVDHLQPIASDFYWHPRHRVSQEEIEGLNNLMPSCRQCNFYKGIYHIDTFRRELKTLMERVRKPFIFRLAEKYRMVEEKKWDGKFYFERIKNWQDEQANNNVKS